MPTEPQLSSNRRKPTEGAFLEHLALMAREDYTAGLYSTPSQGFLSNVCLWSLCGILKFKSVKKLESEFRKQRVFLNDAFLGEINV